MPRLSYVFSAVHLFTWTLAQNAGNQTAENPPALTIQSCTQSGCQPLAGAATLDANWRWAYDSNKKNCYTGNLWDPTTCSQGVQCAQSCSLDGADYEKTYGVTSGGDTLKLAFVTQGPYSKNVGSRLYFSVQGKYFLFQLKNKEFSFTVDVSKVPCGLNGALYFTAMEEDGGMSKSPGNKAGSKYGTGYCDAQCPQDIKWIDGKANSEGWVPSKTDPNSGTGSMGSCCPEMDIWEANSMSQAFTPHTCTTPDQKTCIKDECGNQDGGRYKSPCDKDGCDFSSYRWGAKDFYGSGKTVDTTQKFTVVTQFITADGTDNGPLSEIKRFYIQNGKQIKNEAVQFQGLSQPADSITQQFCDATKTFTGDTNDFKAKGGLTGMDAALDKGMVLVMSLWDDQIAQMNWLDSKYPPSKPPTAPGVDRGTCDPNAGKPMTVRANAPSATVEFSQIKIGSIGSTAQSTSTGSGTGTGTGTGTRSRRSL